MLVRRDRQKERLDRGLLRLILVLAVGGLPPALDTTIVNVAVANLYRSLQAPVATVQWVTAGYLLAFAMTLPLSGWAFDRMGGKRLWLLGLGAFLAGSALSGAAWSIQSLIAFRILQGAAAGLLQPTLQTVLARAAGPGRLGRAITVITYIAVVAPILGPVAGGLILDHLGWRYIFLLNVPIALIALLLAGRFMPEDTARDRRPLDAVGLLLLSPALAGVTYGLTRLAQAQGPRAAAVWPLGVGLALLAAFAVHALRPGQRVAPLLDLRLFRRRAFAVSASLLFLSGLALYGAMLLLPLYDQLVRGESALATGLWLAPQGVGSLLTRWAGGLTDRMGPRPVVLGALLTAAAGTFPFAVAGSATSMWVLALALVVRGAGLGAANIAIIAGAYQGLAPGEVPHASSATRILQQVGGAFGTAVLAAILAGGADLGPTRAFHAAFGWSLAFTLLALALAFALPPIGRLELAAVRS